MSHWCW